MKIAYLANVRIPTEKAHGLQIMQMCAAFASLGHEVTLVVPDRKNPIEEDAFAYYGLEPTFRILKVPVFDWIRFSRWLGPLAVLLLEISYAFAARKALKVLDVELLYSRDTFFTFWASEGPLRTVELHTLPNRFHRIYAALWRRCDRIVTVTEGLREDVMNIGVPADRVMSAHDAVDPGRFTRRVGRTEARRRLSLPEKGVIAIYSGSFGRDKGADVLLEATEHLDGDVLVLMIGDVHPAGDSRHRRIIGRVPAAEVPEWLSAADFALMPYHPTTYHIFRYASPMKLFEYMGMGLPMISSDLPAIREVLSDKESAFVPPGDAEALADAIQTLAGDEARRKGMAEASAASSGDRTWVARGKAVLSDMVRSKDARSGWFRLWPEITVVLFALTVRITYVSFFPQQPLSGGDAPLYLGYADWIRGVSEWPEAAYSTFQVGYPALLAGLRAVLGESLLAVRLVQAVMGAVLVGVLMWMGNRWASRTVGIVAGLVYTLYIPAILQTGIIMTEGLYALALTAAIALMALALERKTWRTALLAGFAAAVAGSIREIGYYGLLLVTGFSAWKRAWKPAVAVALFIVLAATATNIGLKAAVPASERSSGVLISKGYEQVLINDRVFKEKVGDPSRILMWPEGTVRFLLYPYRMNDLSSGVSMKGVLLGGDASAITRHKNELIAKVSVLLMHLAVILLAVIGLSRGKVAWDLKALIVIIGLFSGGSIVLASVGRAEGFAIYMPLSRYAFPIMPLVALLAGAGIERLLLRKSQVHGKR